MKKYNSIILIAAILTSININAQNYFAGGTGTSAAGYGASSNINAVGIGTGSQVSGTTGYFNTSIGNTSLASITGGYWNSAVGDQALGALSTGNGNTGIGALAGAYGITTGSSNTAVGVAAMEYAGGTMSGCSAFGHNALYYTTGAPNDAFGDSALFNNTSGYGNVGIGSQTLGKNVATSGNTGVGTQCLYYNTAGGNSALGYQSLYNNTSGTYNTGLGFQSMYTNTSASYSTAVGFKCMFTNASATSNTGIGFQALYLNTGAGNAALGANAGSAYASNTDCTFLGYYADANATGYSNSVALGYNAKVMNSNTIQLGNSISAINCATTVITTSDKRFKTNVQENVPGLAFIKELRPVTYNFDMHKMDAFIYGDSAASFEKEMVAGIAAKSQKRYTGFLAQDVDVAAKKIGYNFSGVKTPQNEKDMYGLAYSDFVVPLVKGMQEQQSMIDAQANTIAQQQQTLTNVLAKLELVTSQLNDIRECCSNNGSGSNNPSPSFGTPQLFNAIPNPASGSTAVSYFVPSSFKSASIQLSDANGQVLQTAAIYNAGYSSATLPLGNLTSGIYYYSLIVDGKLINTQKLNIVLK